MNIFHGFSGINIGRKQTNQRLDTNIWFLNTLRILRRLGEIYVFVLFSDARLHEKHVIMLHGDR